MDDDWISALSAHGLVSAASPMRAAEAICKRAKDGLVKARARRLVWGQHSADDQAIPASFWWAGGDVALTQNWASGDFETWIDQKLHCRAYGVEFQRTDIEAMVPVREVRNPGLGRSEPGNFASSSRCRDELRAALGTDEKNAERIILKACAAGVVSARCKQISWRVTDRYGPADFEDVNVGIPEWFWDDCLDGPNTLLNWASGRFAGQGYVDGDLYKAILIGVEFRVGDVVELEALVVGHKPNDEEGPVPSGISQSPSTVAGRRLSERWRPWVAELVAYIHEAGIPEGVGSQGQEELIKAVADSLADRDLEAPGRSTVQPVVQAVLDRLRAKN